MRMKRVLAALLCLSLLVAGMLVPAQTAHAAESGMVRVYLLSMNYNGVISNVTITLNGAYEVENHPEITLQSRGSYYIEYYNGSVWLSGAGLDAAIDLGSKFNIKQLADANGNLGTMSLYNPRYGTRSYRGDMQFDIANGGLRLINKVFIEDYLYGVLAGELSNTFPLETLKAQAVIARSYVYPRMLTNEPNYEINDTSSNQVYKGYNSANNNIMKAVNDTAGVLLKYGSSYVDAYFGASNGGQIETPKNAWSSSGSSSLGCYVMKDDPYDLRNSQSRTSTYVFSSTANNVYGMDPFFSLIQDRLSYRVSGATLLRIENVTLENPLQKDSATVGISRNYQDMRLTVAYSDGFNESTTDVVISDMHSTLRSLLFGSDSDLRLFSLNKSGDFWYLTLNRWGHGVGMSQRGAQQMANEGFSYSQIIDFYFPGTKLETKTFKRDVVGNEQIMAETPVAYGTVNASSLNVRGTPSSSGTKLGSVSRNSRVGIIEKTSDGKWYKVNFGSGTGYVSAEYIVLEPGSNLDGSLPNTGNETVIAKAAVTLSVASSSLNMRSAPSSTASVVSRLPNATQLNVLEKTNDSWYKVSTGTGAKGYVSNSYLTITDNNPGDTTGGNNNQNTDTTGSVTGTITTSGSALNVRASASSSSSKIGSLGNGSTVTILGETGDWYKIRYGNGEGYVSSSFVKKNASNGGTNTNDNTGSSGSSTQSGMGILKESDIPNGGVRGTVKIDTGLTLSIYDDTNKAVSLGSLTNGAGVTVLGVLGEMYFVKSDAGTAGFVQKNFIWTATGSASGNTGTGSNNNTNTGNTGNTDSGSSVYAKGTIKLSNTSTTLRLRKSASTTSDVVANMSHGAAIEVMAQTGDWYQVIYGDYKGYVMKSYVKLNDGATVPNGGSSSGSESGSGNTSSGGSSSGATLYHGNIKTSSGSGGVNVRSGPSSSTTALGSMAHGEKAYVLATNGDWYKIVYGNGTGYVLKSYIKLTGETSTGSGGSSSGSSNSGSSSSGGSTSSDKVGKTGTIKLASSTATLNVRSGPGTDYAVAFTVKHGTKLTIQVDHGSWYAVNVSGKTGYVSASYVTLDSGTSSSSSSGTGSTTATTTGSVNLRASSSSTSEKLGTYASGTKVSVLEKGSAWSKVSVGGKTGYMSNTYLSFS